MGIRFGASEEANFYTSLGLQWQKANYVQDFEGSNFIVEDDYIFRRFNFKIGILF
ncbi:MAG: hypothetical protein AAF960_06605 [Bacteroidota bacterium]